LLRGIGALLILGAVVRGGGALNLWQVPDFRPKQSVSECIAEGQRGGYAQLLAGSPGFGGLSESAAPLSYARLRWLGSAQVRSRRLKWAELWAEQSELSCGDRIGCSGTRSEFGLRLASPESLPRTLGSLVPACIEHSPSAFSPRVTRQRPRLVSALQRRSFAFARGC
jgi:hypothetical protein